MTIWCTLVYCTADKDPKSCSSIHCHVWYTTMYTYTQTLFLILSLLFPSALSLITAPVNQYVVEGENIRPECSFDDPSQVYGSVIITIRRNGQPTPIISAARVEDEGEYLCDVNLLSHDASTQVPFTLHVFSECNTSSSAFFYPSQPTRYCFVTGVIIYWPRFTISYNLYVSISANSCS